MGRADGGSAKLHDDRCWHHAPNSVHLTHASTPPAQCETLRHAGLVLPSGLRFSADDGDQSKSATQERHDGRGRHGPGQQVTLTGEH